MQTGSFSTTSSSWGLMILIGPISFLQSFGIGVGDKLCAGWGVGEDGSALSSFWVIMTIFSELVDWGVGSFDFLSSLIRDTLVIITVISTGMVKTAVRNSIYLFLSGRPLYQFFRFSNIE